MCFKGSKVILIVCIFWNQNVAYSAVQYVYKLEATMSLVNASRNRVFCPHCDECVASSTYKYHRRLYFNKVSVY